MLSEGNMVSYLCGSCWNSVGSLIDLGWGLLWSVWEVGCIRVSNELAGHAGGVMSAKRLGTGGQLPPHSSEGINTVYIIAFTKTLDSFVSTHKQDCFPGSIIRPCWQVRVHSIMDFRDRVQVLNIFTNHSGNTLNSSNNTLEGYSLGRKSMIQLYSPNILIKFPAGLAPQNVPA